ETALALAGIDRERTDPPGGAIRRDAGGLPTGVLHEAATALVTAHIPAPSVEAHERAIRRLGQDLVTYGVVAVHDPGSLRPSPGLGGPYAAYGNLADRHELPVRVHVSIRSEALAAAVGAGLRSGTLLGDDPAGRARIGWLKLFADGSLGSRTAAMLAPFEPPAGSPFDPRDTGIWVTEPAHLAELTARAAVAGIATQIHGIGDAAVRAALDAFEPPATRGLPYRARIEHAQLVDPADLSRFGALGVVASIQPIHLRADAAQARRSWGARAERSAYAWGSLLRAGATLAFGTDAPVEPVDPWPGILLAMSRRSPEWPPGTPAFGPEEGLTLDAALRAACLGPAEAAGSTDRGRLTTGQRADVVVVRANLTSRPRVVLIDGQVAYEA
ncbi:MAG TPA: amidohydrolase family protein, partial [Candidatus Limnocylindrales bacterium]